MGTRNAILPGIRRTLGLYPPDTENPKPELIIFKGEDLKNDAKLECQKKQAKKIIAKIKNNIKYKGYISHICLGHI